MTKEQLMKSLGISEVEALDILKSDKAIDKGEKLFEVETKVKPKIERKLSEKVDQDKRDIVHAILEVLEDNETCCREVTEINVTNIERQIDFIYHDRRFRIVVSCPRK